ncbi:MAG: acyl-CoA dehydrogenase [Alphaproteobacteria bacterium]|nr:acyl-CoA dehydrogenase [Alphaproteobacteria bacterium]
MTSYDAPLADMRFLLHGLGLLKSVNALPGMEEATEDLVDAILEEASKLARDKLAPINHPADLAGGSKLENGVVRTPDGWKEAYDAFVEGGWNAVPFDSDFGGQGLPWLVGIALQEMWQSANMAWALCPLLTQGAVELLSAHGSNEQKAAWLPKLISGEWTGTMNLTEPGAGSDVGALKTRAEKSGDHYLIRGQKIFITYGEHDLTDNTVHMVLARTPDAPAGVKGISLFIVPKVMVNPDGSPGGRNDLRCVSLEEKLGIHGSPTCVMAYGDNEGAVGYLVGEENRGMEYMFTMMNNARISVGLEGVSIAERAYQQARAYARERVQGKTVGNGGGAIIGHPDVRRMLMTMRALTEATRAVTYDLAAMLDISNRHKEESWRTYAARRVALLTPVVKAWCTDMGVEVASLGVQVHGGMGYIEESGAAQHYRDARIAPIYEGTNGVQALDLVGRKLLRDKGEGALEYVDEVHSLINGLNQRSEEDLVVIRRHLAAGVDALDNATHWLLDAAGGNQVDALAGATPYLRLFGIVAGGAMLARLALRATESIEAGGDDPILADKLVVARFYAEQILPQASGLATSISAGSGAIMALAEDRF